VVIYPAKLKKRQTLIRTSPMKIKIRDKQDITIVSLEGNIMQEDISIFRSRLDDLVQCGKLKIILDLSGVNFLNSMFIAVIVETQNRLGNKKGTIKLAAVNFLIKNIFDLTRLSGKFDMYNSVEEALLEFN
jgi:anti-anti-sigma factor